jgi:hypothetical protein
MDTQEIDDQTDDDDVMAHRERAATKLDQIARDAKDALAENGLEKICLFFLIPNSGRSILVFGTPGDPSDDLWSKVGEIVEAIVARLIGLRGTRRREVRCATTHDQALA